MRRNLPILEPSTGKMTKYLAEPLILAFSPIGEKRPPLPLSPCGRDGREAPVRAMEWAWERVGVRVLAIAAVIALITPATASARDVIHKGDIVVVPLQGEIST